MPLVRKKRCQKVGRNGSRRAGSVQGHVKCLKPTKEVCRGCYCSDMATDIDAVGLGSHLRMFGGLQSYIDNPQYVVFIRSASVYSYWCLAFSESEAAPLTWLSSQWTEGRHVW